METAFNIKAKELDAFTLKQSMKDFVDIITNKAVNARLTKDELKLGPKIGCGVESEVFKSAWLGTDVAVKYFRYPENKKTYVLWVAQTL